MFLERSLNDPPPPPSNFKHSSLLPPPPQKKFHHTLYQSICLLQIKRKMKRLVLSMSPSSADLKETVLQLGLSHNISLRMSQEPICQTSRKTCQKASRRHLPVHSHWENYLINTYPTFEQNYRINLQNDGHNGKLEKFSINKNH